MQLLEAINSALCEHKVFIPEREEVPPMFLFAWTRRRASHKNVNMPGREHKHVFFPGREDKVFCFNETEGQCVCYWHTLHCWNFNYEVNPLRMAFDPP